MSAKSVVGNMLLTVPMEAQMLFCITSWQLWKHRNAVLFEDARSTLHDTFSLAWRTMEEWQFKLGPSRKRAKERTLGARWRPPSPGHLKLNSDAALFSDDTVGLGFVIRNDRGEVMAAGSRRY